MHPPLFVARRGTACPIIPLAPPPGATHNTAMPILRAAAAVLLLLLSAVPAPAREAMPIPYPETRRQPLTETLFGEQVADPYRWLENDVRQDAEVADWVARENAATNGYLAGLPARDWFRTRITQLMDYERFGLPVKAGRRYFYMRNGGLQNQSTLWVREGLKRKARLLLDPNLWAKDAATALDDWKPSHDGRFLLYSVQDAGSDWRVLRVLDAASARPLPDEIRWAKFTGLAWVGDEGFLYSRFPPPADGETFQARTYNQAIWFHRLGTPQSADELVFATPDQPETGHHAAVTADGRWAVITSSTGTDARHEVRVIDLAARRQHPAAPWQVRTLVSGFDHDWQLVESLGSRMWFVTNADAPLYRLVSIDLDRAGAQWSDVVREGADKLEQASIVGTRLILSYLKDATTRAVIVDLAGKPAREISLAEIGTASGFRGRPGDPETFYAFTSFNRPSTIYRLNLASGRTTIFAEPKLTFVPDDYLVEQRFYASKDGTQIPMFLVRSKAVAASGRAVPTLLYGYGGFDVSLTPSFSAGRMAWLEAGGAFALANIRGGGEYGRAWHDAGRREHKQNVFDDFIAAGETLIRTGVTAKGGLAIQGGSNGGLLVGAVVNQRPDLFAAAAPQVGVMDMLRFDRFTAGRYWVDDYGYPDREADFKILRAYSPYHNIPARGAYPAILVSTADTDDRVVPGHSFKYAAALQAADLGPKPRLIRIETRAGHGSGKPTDKAIEESADVLAFLGEWTGLKPVR